MGSIISSILFLPPELPTHLHRKHYFWIQTKLGSRIPAIYIKNSKAKYTIIYSHGNAEDLGKIFHFLLNISKILNVAILAYDYTGYGLGSLPTKRSPEKKYPSEENCYADIEAAYHYLTELESVPPQRIILYGRSLGSGPSCYLAQKLSRENDNVNIAGLILHSPFLSVCRVVVDMGFTWSTDMFPNSERIGDVRCPTFIIHGTQDEVVPFNHGKELYDRTHDDYKVSPFWARNMGHNNIEADMGKEFVKKLIKFLTTISHYQSAQKVHSMSHYILTKKMKKTKGKGGTVDILKDPYPDAIKKYFESHDVYESRSPVPSERTTTKENRRLEKIHRSDSTDDYSIANISKNKSIITV